MKITRRQLRKLISESIYSDEPRNRNDTDDILRSQAAIGRESTLGEDKIIGMMVGDDDPNVFDLIYSDPMLERQASLAHVQTVIGILQNNPAAFTPRVQNDCTGVHSTIKYHDEPLHDLFKALQHHLHALNPILFG